MDPLIKDICYCIRSLLKQPAFTLIAVLALVLDIGANFSSVYAQTNVVNQNLSAEMDKYLEDRDGQSQAVRQLCRALSEYERPEVHHHRHERE